MFRTTIAASVVGLASLAFTAPSNAAKMSVTIGSPAGYGAVEFVDHRGGWHDRLSPRDVRRILRDEGFRRIQFLDRGGRIYTASAEDWRGREVIVRVSSRSGAIISVDRIGRRGGHRDHDRPRCWLPEGCGY